jgi:hypothetical protein
MLKHEYFNRAFTVAESVERAVSWDLLSEGAMERQKESIERLAKIVGGMLEAMVAKEHVTLEQAAEMIGFQWTVHPVTAE